MWYWKLDIYKIMAGMTQNSWKSLIFIVVPFEKENIRNRSKILR